MNLSKPEELMSFLKRFGIRPDKSLGQNFLVDEKVLHVIVRAAELKGNEAVVEVGAGPGVLSQELAPSVQKLLSLDVDRRFERPWHELMKSFSNAELLVQDVLTFRPPNEPYKLVANIPYFITSPILKHFLRHQEIRRPELIVLLIQKEVAERIVDRKKPTLLSWEIGVFGEPSIVGVVPPSSFFPSPKVDSAVLKINVFPTPRVELNHQEGFFKMLCAAYRQPRKMLSNNLPGADRWKNIVDPKLRPHQLSLEDWKKLFQKISNVS